MDSEPPPYPSPCMEKQPIGPSPGKTAPRLLHDALLHDPHAAFNDNLDILADPAPIHDSTRPPRPPQLVDSCRHDYKLMGGRSKIPKKDYRPQAGDSWKLEAICSECRLHIILKLEYPFDARRPCPNSDYPLHHFRYSSPDSTPALSYTFVCSSAECGAIATISYRPSMIGDEDIRLLTDPELLEARYRAAVEGNQGRTGFLLATPVNTLWKLRRYLRDALKDTEGTKKIPANNKRFIESFGPDTNELLKRLGFTYTAGDDASWALPRASDTTSPLRKLIEDWEMELQAVISFFAARDGDLNPDPEYMWFPARPEMERILSVQGYAKSTKTRSSQDQAAIDHPFYASLGAMRDFSDNLVAFAYERQTACDPDNAPYYFDCLQDLARGRESEPLILQASLLESQGVIGGKVIQEAYAFFGFKAGTAPTDQAILNRFQSRLEDTGIAARPELRAKLKVLATSRQSSILADAANDTLDTYPQALAWLGAEASYPDDSILTLFAAKVGDDPANEVLARRAVKLIADSRDSAALHSWLTTGEMKDTGMSIDEACTHLKIKLDDVDEGMLQLVFESARSDNPGQRTDQAIDTVMNAYHKPKELSTHTPQTWPVGLTSHGNTCYLNSLLQYYFTIKPLRDIVLNFDDHKFDLSAHGNKEERVGSRKVTPLEIRAYQKFVEELKRLFERMILDPGPAVKPEADLVCRAFLKAEETEDQTEGHSRAESPPADIAIEQPRPQRASEGKLQKPSSLVRDDKINASTVSLVDITMEDQSGNPAEMPPSPPATPHDDDEEMKDVSSLEVPALPPRQLTTPVRQQTNLTKAEEAARQQQDVTEVMDEILFRLRCAIQPSGMDNREEQLDKLRDIFYMKISEKTLDDAGKESVREEYALNILLNIPNRPTDIYEALDEIFELQTIDHGDKKLKQYKTLQSLPPMLQINIPRITYDRTTGRGVKVDHKVHLEESLYLDKYFEWDTPGIMSRREESWKWRQQLLVLQAQRDVLTRNAATELEGPVKLQAVSKHLKNLQSSNQALEALGLDPIEFDVSMIEDLDSMASTMQAQLKDIDEQIAVLQRSISSSFNDKKQLKYRLHSVFFHRGGYGHGHYWSCIYDFDNSMWRVYNDEKVDQLTNVDDIFNAQTWQQGTPTYAVYVKDDVRDQYVQAVCRDPEVVVVDEATTKVEMVDEVMQDQPPLPQSAPPPKPEEDEDQEEDMLEMHRTEKVVW